MTNEPKYVRYPMVSLSDSVKRLYTVYAKVGRKSVDRIMLAQSMGYKNRNGASDGAAAGLAHYGLIDDYKNIVKISPVGLEIVLGEPGEASRVEALELAALTPPIFAELHGQYGDSTVSHNTLIRYLVKRGFNPAAAERAAKTYSDTMEFVAQERALRGGDLPPDDEQEAEVQAEPYKATNSPPPQNMNQTIVAPPRSVTFGVPIDVLGHIATVSIPDDVPFDKGIDSLLFQLNSFKEMIKDQFKAEQDEQVARDEADANDPSETQH